MGKGLDDMFDAHAYSLMNDINPLRPYLRIRETGDGKWAIVRGKPFQQYGSEVVAEGLTRKQAEQMIALAKEE